MRRRVDLGQSLNGKEAASLERKKRNWAARHKDKAEENPFLAAIKPDQDNYGDPEEKGDELKARLENLEFGNFPGYFNYRNKSTPKADSSSTDDKKKKKTNDKDDTEEPPPALEIGLNDDRLTLLRKEWFNEKHVLDIGCNRGHITYAIAKLFSPISIVGIDIDAKVINMANRDLHLHLEDGLLRDGQELRRERAAKLRLTDETTYREEANHFTLSSYISQGPIAVSTAARETPQQQQKESKDNPQQDQQSHTQISTSKFPNNLVFVEHNYILSNDELVDKQKAYFDTIVCLSVTKWIHLNYRDDGLKRFFKRIYKHLKLGGLMILEAQPYDNYARRKKLSDRLRANFYSINFKPEHFDAYLLSEEVGFREIIYQSVTEHECAGFKRPLKVFLK